MSVESTWAVGIPEEEREKFKEACLSVIKEEFIDEYVNNAAFYFYNHSCLQCPEGCDGEQCWNDSDERDMKDDFIRNNRRLFEKTVEKMGLDHRSFKKQKVVEEDDAEEQEESSKDE